MKILDCVNKMQKKLVHMSLQPVYMTDELKNYYSIFPINCEISGANAVVTGGGSGIGFAIAKMLISQGCNVLLVGSNKNKLQNAVQLLGKNIDYYCWDLNEVKEIEKHIVTICEKFENNKLDIWVNCHGIYSEYDSRRAFRNVPMENLEKVLKLNCQSTEKLTDFVAGRMIKSGKRAAHILNISSICATMKSAVYTPYGLSKAGIIHSTRILAKKYENRGIVINAIAPGTVATKFIWDIDEKTNIAYDANVIKRFIFPEEIAAIAVMMVSPYGNDLNGAVLTVSACERI
jgi:NAD(P)-dependent dehydrogenase (short-subunit alcohol dehydrogenase family)